jgi:hypothetical protein
MHAHDIVSKRMDGRDASFIRVRDLAFWKMIDFYPLPNSMSNLLTKTSAFETVPKISSCKRSSGNFCTLSSSPFPKAKNLKRRNPKLFVSRLFGKFMPSYPTLMGTRRFRSTRRLGASTPLTSNPSSVSSVALKTGEDGGWSTAAVHWHMRYSLRRISPMICPSEWALREHTLRVVCRALFGTTSPCRTSSVRGPTFRTTPTSPPSFSCLLTGCASSSSGRRRKELGRRNGCWLTELSGASHFTLSFFYSSNIPQGERSVRAFVRV